MDSDVDRLSSLPDDVIHKILSFVSLEDVIRTSVLSSRWTSIWTSLPYLEHLSREFCNNFPQFVNLLPKLNNLLDVFSIMLLIYGNYNDEHVKQIVKYAFTRNIQQLEIEFVGYANVDFLVSFFSSKSLKHLTFSSGSLLSLCPQTWELPALTTLFLSNINLCSDEGKKCVGFFENYPNLKNLTLEYCETQGINGLSICNPLLCDLRLDHVNGSLSFLVVVAPKLKNLIIISDIDLECQISAPDLTSLRYRGYVPLKLSTQGFPCLEEVDLCIWENKISSAHKIIRLFQQLQSVKCLRLNLDMVQVLCKWVEINSDQPSPFANLKSLNIYPHEDEDATVPIEVKNYFLANSPNAATFTPERYQYIIERTMEISQEWLEEVKADILAQVQMEQHVNKCLENMRVQIDKWRLNIDEINFDLNHIKQVLTPLLASRKAEADEFTM